MVNLRNYPPCFLLEFTSLSLQVRFEEILASINLKYHFLFHTNIFCFVDFQYPCWTEFGNRNSSYSSIRISWGCLTKRSPVWPAKWILASLAGSVDLGKSFHNCSIHSRQVGTIFDYFSIRRKSRKYFISYQIFSKVGHTKDLSW